MRAMSAVSRAASVPAAPMATPRVAAARAGASLTPSPTIATAPARSRSSATAATFCSGSRPARTSVDAGLGGHGGGRLRVVAGEHGDVARSPSARSSLDRLAGARAQRVADGDHAERAVLVADHDGRLALALEPLDGSRERRVGGVRAEEVGPADEVQPAVQLGPHAAPGDGAEALDVGTACSWSAARRGRRPSAAAWSCRSASATAQQPGVEQEQAAGGRGAVGTAPRPQAVPRPSRPARSVIALASGCSL